MSIIANHGADVVCIAAATAVLADHGGRLIVRARASTFDAADANAYETQIIEFASPAGLASYMDDERRAAFAHLRDATIARTELQYVDLV